jgi:predicted ester cyclase
MNQLQQNKSTIIRFFECFSNDANLEFEENWIHKDVQFILSFSHVDGLTQVRNLIQKERSVFENLKYTIIDSGLVLEEFSGAAFWLMTGKQVDSWNGIPATCNEINVSGASLFSFDVDGKIKEIRIQIDLLSLMSQINGITKLYDF